MRLSPAQRDAVRSAILGEAGADARVILFGSRLDYAARGGDVDLMVEFLHAIDNPAVLSARMAARASRALGGRRVDVILCAPNLRQGAIHRQAAAEGIPL